MLISSHTSSLNLWSKLVCQSCLVVIVDEGVLQHSQTAQTLLPYGDINFQNGVKVCLRRNLGKFKEVFLTKSRLKISKTDEF